LLAAGGELAPEIVDFFLGLAVHRQRYRFGELELRAAVEGDELLALELEIDRQNAPLRAGRRAVVAGDAQDLRVLEDRGVVTDRFLGIVVEPEECLDSLPASHGDSPC